MSIFMHAPDNFHPVTAANAICNAPREERRAMLDAVPEAWQDFVFTLANNAIKLRAYWRRKRAAGEDVPEVVKELID